MARQNTEDVTVLLNQSPQGGAQTLDDVISSIYQEMQSLVHTYLSTDSTDPTLCTSSITLATSESSNEVNHHPDTQQELKFKNLEELFTFASNNMRQTLVDFARSNCIEEIPNDNNTSVNEDNIESFNDKRFQEICDIDDTLKRLKPLFPLGEQILEYGLLCGLNLSQMAKLLNTQEQGLQEDWNTALAWLRKEIRAQDDLITTHKNTADD